MAVPNVLGTLLLFAVQAGVGMRPVGHGNSLQLSSSSDGAKPWYDNFLKVGEAVKAAFSKRLDSAAYAIVLLDQASILQLVKCVIDRPKLDTTKASITLTQKAMEDPIEFVVDQLQYAMTVRFSLRGKVTKTTDGLSIDASVKPPQDAKISNFMHEVVRRALQIVKKGSMISNYIMTKLPTSLGACFNEQYDLKLMHIRVFEGGTLALGFGVFGENAPWIMSDKFVDNNILDKFMPPNSPGTAKAGVFFTANLFPMLLSRSVIDQDLMMSFQNSIMGFVDFFTSNKHFGDFNSALLEWVFPQAEAQKVSVGVAATAIAGIDGWITTGGITENSVCRIVKGLGSKKKEVSGSGKNQTKDGKMSIQLRDCKAVRNNSGEQQVYDVEKRIDSGEQQFYDVEERIDSGEQQFYDVEERIDSGEQ